MRWKLVLTSSEKEDMFWYYFNDAKEMTSFMELNSQHIVGEHYYNIYKEKEETNEKDKKKHNEKGIWK